MAKVITSSKYYQAIADLLRAEAYSEELTQKRYKPSEMAGGVTRVADENREAGIKMGETIGEKRILTAMKKCFSDRNYDYPEVEEDVYFLTNVAMMKEYNRGKKEGKQEEYDRFWDVFQENGQRGNYFYAFAGGGWTPETFKPKYPIRIVETAAPNRHCEGMFYGFMRGYEEQPISLTPEMVDFSQAMLIQDTFSCANFDTITADFSNAVSLYGAFQQHKAKNQEKTTRAIHLKVTEKCTNFTGTFNQCRNLEELLFTEDSTIAAKIDVTHCEKLSRESLLSILYALKDGASLTCTLGTVNLAKLTDEEKAIATEKGWILA